MKKVVSLVLVGVMIVAFSDYYHRTRNHWSYVASGGLESKVDATAGHTSHAFINTSFGAHAIFDYGFND